MAERTVFIRDSGGSAPFRVVIKPHPGVGKVAGNVFGLATREAALAEAARLAAQWACPVTDETAA